MFGQTEEKNGSQTAIPWSDVAIMVVLVFPRLIAVRLSCRLYPATQYFSAIYFLPLITKQDLAPESLVGSTGSVIIRKQSPTYVRHHPHRPILSTYR